MVKLLKADEKVNIGKLERGQTLHVSEIGGDGAYSRQPHEISYITPELEDLFRQRNVREVVFTDNYISTPSGKRADGYRLGDTLYVLDNGEKSYMQALLAHEAIEDPRIKEEADVEYMTERWLEGHELYDALDRAVGMRSDYTVERETARLLPTGAYEVDDYPNKWFAEPIEFAKDIGRQFFNATGADFPFTLFWENRQDAVRRRRWIVSGTSAQNATQNAGQN